MGKTEFLEDIVGKTIENAFKETEYNYIAIKFTDSKYLRLKVEHGEIIYEWF